LLENNPLIFLTPHFQIPHNHCNIFKAQTHVPKNPATRRAFFQVSVLHFSLSNIASQFSLTKDHALLKKEGSCDSTADSSLPFHPFSHTAS